MAPETDVRGVFFDLYGTLLVMHDAHAAWAAWFDAFYAGLRPHGLDAARDDFARTCDGFFTRPGPAEPADNLSVYECRIRDFCTELGLHLERRALRRLADDSASAWERHVRLDPEAHFVLEALAPRKRLALVSNYDHPPHVHALLRRLDLDRFFHPVVISGEVGVKKPDPAIFRMALRPAGLRADQVVFVGDSDDDVAGALAVGATPVRIRRPAAAHNTEMGDFRAAPTSWKPPVDPPDDAAATIARLTELLPLVQ